MVARYRISATKRVAKKTSFAPSLVTSPDQNHPLLNSANSTVDSTKSAGVTAEWQWRAVFPPRVGMAAAAAVISNMDEPFRASGGQVILTEALCPKQCRYLMARAVPTIVPSRVLWDS